uniref:Uncharacterized protein n=1 Tax=Solanum tuberosum TaxID=4113 RepID=Q60CX7_SOLTU|nr:hypothetical protein STB1_57t00013 [Solanum tuberosum]
MAPMLRSPQIERDLGFLSEEEKKREEGEEIKEFPSEIIVEIVRGDPYQELAKQGRNVEFSGLEVGASRLPARPKEDSEVQPLGRRATQSARRYRYPESASYTSLIQLSTPESVVSVESRKPGQGFAWGQQWSPGAGPAQCVGSGRDINQFNFNAER